MKCSAGDTPNEWEFHVLAVPMVIIESPGQVECHECKSRDGQLMSNAPDFRSCVVISLSILGYLLDNAATTRHSLESASFGIVCSLMYYERTVAIREQQESKELALKTTRGISPRSVCARW